MPSWMKPWHPTGLDEVRETVARSAASVPHDEGGLPPLSSEDEAKFSARREQDQFEAVEKARESGRQEALNKDQFKEGWDAGQEAIKRQRAQQRAAGASSRRVVRRVPVRRAKPTGSIARQVRSSGNAFKRRK